MGIKTTTYILPEQALCYFEYGDDCGLEAEDIEKIDNFISDENKERGSISFLTSDEETRDFIKYHDLQRYGWLTDSCVEMVFSVER